MCEKAAIQPAVMEQHDLVASHGILLNSEKGRDKGGGSFRRVQNWIGTPGSTMEQAHFVPPAPERLMEFLDNWEKYSRQPKVGLHRFIVGMFGIEA